MKPSYEEKKDAAFMLLGQKFKSAKAPTVTGPRFCRNAELAVKATEKYFAMLLMLKIFAWQLAIGLIARLALAYAEATLSSDHNEALWVFTGFAATGILLYSLRAWISNPWNKTCVELAKEWKPVRRKLEKFRIPSRISDHLFASSPSTFRPDEDKARDERHSVIIKEIVNLENNNHAHAIDLAFADAFQGLARRALDCENRGDARGRRMIEKEMDELMALAEAHSNRPLRKGTAFSQAQRDMRIEFERIPAV